MVHKALRTWYILSIYEIAAAVITVIIKYMFYARYEAKCFISYIIEDINYGIIGAVCTSQRYKAPWKNRMRALCNL